MAKWLLKTLILLLILGGGYIAWPRYSVEQLENAARTEDLDKLQRYIDFPELRDNLQQRLQRQLRDSMGEEIPPELSDLFVAGSNLFMAPLLRQLITPGGVAELLRGGRDLRAFERELYRQQWEPMEEPDRSGPDAVTKENGWQLQGWRLTGLNRAAADYGDGESRELRLILERQGLHWRLVDIALLGSEREPDS